MGKYSQYIVKYKMKKQVVKQYTQYNPILVRYILHV